MDQTGLLLERPRVPSGLIAFYCHRYKFLHDRVTAIDRISGSPRESLVVLGPKLTPGILMHHLKRGADLLEAETAVEGKACQPADVNPLLFIVVCEFREACAFEDGLSHLDYGPEAQAAVLIESLQEILPSLEKRLEMKPPRVVLQVRLWVGSHLLPLCVEGREVRFWLVVGAKRREILSEVCRPLARRRVLPHHLFSDDPDVWTLSTQHWQVVGGEDI